MKGQASFIMKPMMLIGVIILLLFLIQSLYSGRGREKIAEKKLDIVGTATNILLILSNSNQCLAYNSSVTGKTQGSVLNVTKIDFFDSNYREVEPECARNYEFGWRVEISQIDKNGKIERSWDFGAKEFSTGKSMSNEIRFWIPVAIKYPKGDRRCGSGLNLEGCTKLGKMDIILVDGELEKLAGFFDWSCKMGKYWRLKSTSIEFSVNQPVTYNSLENKICIGNSCRKLLCPLLYFDGFKSKGIYNIQVNYQDGSLKVGT